MAGAGGARERRGERAGQPARQGRADGRGAALDDAAPTGWLHGIPFAVKDLVATAGLRTTWGSPVFADHVPARDDLVAARLRAAGAVICGQDECAGMGARVAQLQTPFSA